MKAVIKQFAAQTLRRGARLVLQRPWLKKRVRDMITRMPGLHAWAMRVMFQSPVPARPRINIEQTGLSPNARRVHSALKQAIRTRRR